MGLADLDAREVLGDAYDELAARVMLADGTFEEIVEEVIDGTLMIDLPAEIEAGEYEELTGTREDDLRAWLVGLLAGEFAEHLAWQRGLDGENTDGDRVTAAFGELNGRAIVARENFSCCQRCGLLEIREQEHDRDDEPARGYVFYHEQDTLQRPVHLAYEGSDGSVESRVAVGGEVVEVLRAHGLTPQWDGDPGKRIALDVDLRRVRAGELAEYPGSATAPASG